MEGPNDATEVITEIRQPEPLPRPPGGKALVRLTETLMRSGLDDVARHTVESAVGEQASSYDTVLSLGTAPAGRTTSTKKSAASTARARQKNADQGAAAAESYADAWSEAAHLMGPPTSTGPQWRSLGPTTITNGQTYGASRVNVSGRVSALAIDPSNATHVLAGAAHGGVWESRDGGSCMGAANRLRRHTHRRSDRLRSTASGNGLLRHRRRRLVVLARQRSAAVHRWRHLVDTPLHEPIRRPGLPQPGRRPVERGAPVRRDHGRSVRLQRLRSHLDTSTDATHMVDIDHCATVREVLAVCADGVRVNRPVGQPGQRSPCPPRRPASNESQCRIAPSNRNVAYVWAADNLSPSGTHLWRRARVRRGWRGRSMRRLQVRAADKAGTTGTSPLRPTPTPRSTAVRSTSIAAT